MKKQTNLMFFQQNEIEHNGENGYDSISQIIENSYKTICYMCSYSLYRRVQLANDADKKFGFVLKSLKK